MILSLPSLPIEVVINVGTILVEFLRQLALIGKLLLDSWGSMRFDTYIFDDLILKFPYNVNSYF